MILEKRILIGMNEASLIYFLVRALFLSTASPAFGNSSQIKMVLILACLRDHIDGSTLQTIYNVKVIY